MTASKQQPASYRLHGCSPLAAYMRGCRYSMQAAGNTGNGAQWLRNRNELIRTASVLIAGADKTT